MQRKRPEVFTKEEVERVAERFHTTGYAAQALGISSGSFSRLCKKHGIETPTRRTQRKAAS